MKTTRWLFASLLLGSAPFLLGMGASEFPEFEKARTLAEKITAETKRLHQDQRNEPGSKGVIKASATVTPGQALRQGSRQAQQYAPQGWRIRLVGLAARNPATTPDPFEATILNQFETWKAQGRLTPASDYAEVVEEDGKPFLRYLKPLVIGNARCPTCAGDSEERGAVSITIPLAWNP